MKPKTKITNSSLENIVIQLWTTFLVILIIINNIDAIRVYEGTNIPAPEKITKSTALHKKASFISKRSWHPADESLKSSTKLEKKSDGKWKELNKRIMEMPSLYKIRFSDEKYMQNLKYIREIPRLEEYTFCMWYKPTNLSHDQTIFFYSLKQNEILLRFWINAADSTLRMAIRENVVFKVPANIREYKWHHICQSWNGVLGELQVFLDGKRIGAGVISHYKGTYIPEGGEVTLGQDFAKFGKILDDRLEGEMFGFNLVDEAVPHDQGSFINSQYKPSVSAVPPFKKLPPIKKTYQEIKAYISALPATAPEGRIKNEALTGEETNSYRKPKEPFVPPKRSRGNSRIRYPPLRKVVIYNRDDRQLDLNEGMLELNRTKPVQSVRVKTTTETPQNETINQISKQPYDENYSIHSYRFGKQPKTSNYEIYEIIEDDENPETVEQVDVALLQRKARQNFNLFTAREANKVYTLSSSVKDSKKPKFHFEIANSETTQTPQKSTRRSFEVEEKVVPVLKVPLEKSQEAKLPGFIPVYEVEVAESRRKRSADDKREPRQFSSDDPLVDSNGFRRLPQIPDSFINLFTKNATKSELDEKLEEFFPKEEPKQSNILATVTEPPQEYPEVVIAQEPQPTETAQQRSAEVEEVLTVTEIPVVDIPEFSPMPESIVKAEYRTSLGTSQPVEYQPDQFQEFNPRKPFGEIDVTLGYKKKEPSRRKFHVSAGTDLVMRSYGACTAERGSPVEDTERLVISWADTPVRIFGGAQVEGARNECGHF